MTESVKLQPNFIPSWESSIFIREAMDPREQSIQNGEGDLHITAGERFGVEQLPFLGMDILFWHTDIEAAVVNLFKEGSRRPNSLEYRTFY